MSQVYQWLVFVHVLGIFGFLMGHGASAVMVFRLRRECDLARVSALLDLSRSGNMVANQCLLVALLAGAIAGFLGNWWGQGWIWAALGLLIALAIAMFALASAPLERVRHLLRAMEQSGAANTATETTVDGGATQSLVTTQSSYEKRIAAQLDATHPMLISTLGAGVLAVILWLMLFKPF